VRYTSCNILAGARIFVSCRWRFSGSEKFPHVLWWSQPCWIGSKIHRDQRTDINWARLISALFVLCIQIMWAHFVFDSSQLFSNITSWLWSFCVCWVIFKCIRCSWTVPYLDISLFCSRCTKCTEDDQIWLATSQPCLNHTNFENRFTLLDVNLISNKMVCYLKLTSCNINDAMLRNVNLMLNCKMLCYLKFTSCNIDDTALLNNNFISNETSLVRKFF